MLLQLVPRILIQVLLSSAFNFFYSNFSFCSNFVVACLRASFCLTALSNVEFDDRFQISTHCMSGLQLEFAYSVDFNRLVDISRFFPVLFITYCRIMLMIFLSEL